MYYKLRVDSCPRPDSRRVGLLWIMYSSLRDEGSYQLNDVYDRFLYTASYRRVKNRKNWVPASSDELIEVETSI